MKNRFFMLLFILTGLFFSACQNKIVLPNLAFKTEAGYTYNEVNLMQGDSVKVGILASEGKKNQPLKTLKVVKIYNNDAPTDYMNISITDAEAASYSKDIWLKAGNQTAQESYMFTITDAEGLENSISITLKVQ